MNVYDFYGDSDKAFFEFRGVHGHPPFSGTTLDCRIEDRDPDILSRAKFAETFPRYETAKSNSPDPQHMNALTFPKFEIVVGSPRSEGRILYKTPLFLDAHFVFSHPFGFVSCVSQRFMECMAPYLSGQCVFVPVEVAGAPAPYFILWVTRILDALDEEQTRVATSWKDGRKVIARAKFREEVVGGSLLFRLPGKRYFAQDSDYATEPFIELCQRHELTGLEFMETFTAEFVATSKKPARKQAPGARTET
jgi:hypothetical protein